MQTYINFTRIFLKIIRKNGIFEEQLNFSTKILKIFSWWSHVFFPKHTLFFQKKTSNKGLNKNWFPAKFQKTLYGIDFAMTF